MREISDFWAGILAGFFGGMIFVAVMLSLTNSDADAKWRGVCEYKHGHVAQLDSDHRVCIVNGAVVKW